MATLNEKQLLTRLRKAKKVFLLEPDYTRKYPPLGLMKIAAYVQNHGGKVKFGRNYLGEKCDLVCVTSLFTYECGIVHHAIKQVRELNKKVKILVGGVYVSLMERDFIKEFPDVDSFKGFSKELDQTLPNYSIDWQLEEPWNDFSFTFTTRGCPNKCAYCSVWRIEPGLWINPKWKESILDDKPCAMISDNNLSAYPTKHVKNVVEFLAKKKKKVVFDNGFDCKHITKPMANLLGKLRFTRCGMRMAFDRIEEDEIFQKAAGMLKAGGVPPSQTMAYVLFNFKDIPQEADYRMQVCRKHGIRPYPQKYQPLNQKSRKPIYIGKYWTKNLANRFRYFWLMAGYNTKMTFDQFINQRCHQGPVKLNKEDWAAWHAGEKKWKAKKKKLKIKLKK